MTTKRKKKSDIKCSIAVMDGGVVMVMTSKPVKCGCGQMSTQLVNRLGQTRCLDCDRIFIKSIQIRTGRP